MIDGCVNWTPIFTQISPDWFLSSQLIAERYCWLTIAEYSATWHFSFQKKIEKQQCKNKKNIQIVKIKKLKSRIMQNLSDLLGLKRDISVFTRKIFKMKCEDIEKSSKYTAKSKVISRKQPNLQFSGTKMATVSQFHVKF